MSRDPDSSILSGDRAGLTVGLLMAITIVAFEALAVGTVVPRAEEDLGHLELYGWVFSGFLLASVVGIAWSGEQADQHGPGRPLAIGMTLFAIGLTIAGLAPTMHVLVLGRVIQGLGGGALPAVVYVVIGRGYPESLRPRMLAMLATAWVVPGFIGPAIGGAVAEWISWRATFLMIVPLLPLAALLTLPALFRLGPPPPSEKAPSRLPTALTLTFGAGLALAGIATGSVLFGAPLVVVGLVVGFPALKKLLPPGTLRAQPGVPAAIGGNGFLNMAFFSADAFIPYLLTTHRGYSTLVAGLALTSATISWTAGSWIQERLATRTTRAARAGVGSAILTVGVAATTIALIDAVPGGLVAVTWAIAGLGIGLTYPTFSLEMLAGTPPGREGEVSSAMKLTETLSAAAGVGVAGGIVAAGEAGGWEGPAIAGVFILAAVAGVMTMLIASRLSHEVGRAAESSQPQANAGQQPAEAAR
ncbi:MAG: MFS transporter [Dehalococcoidia bacterium]